MWYNYWDINAVLWIAIKMEIISVMWVHDGITWPLGKVIGDSVFDVINWFERRLGWISSVLLIN